MAVPGGCEVGPGAHQVQECWQALQVSPGVGALSCRGAGTPGPGCAVPLPEPSVPRALSARGLADMARARPLSQVVGHWHRWEGMGDVAEPPRLPGTAPHSTSGQRNCLQGQASGDSVGTEGREAGILR